MLYELILINEIEQRAKIFFLSVHDIAFITECDSAAILNAFVY